MVKLKYYLHLTVISLSFLMILFVIYSKADNISFRKAKEIAHKQIYTGELQQDYYCGCLYYRNKEVNLNSCGYKIRKNATRAKRIEWEHVVPASWYGKTEECWYQGGRKNCQKKSEAFEKFEGDLHNLRPVVGEVNSDRSDLTYGIVGQYYKTYGNCQFKIDFKNNVVEPPDSIKGDLARISLYIIQKYNLLVPEQTKKLWLEWNNIDPVSDLEILINKKIHQIQGDSNIYIDESKGE